MTDFERYLGVWILNSGEDHCSRCAYCTPVGEDGICKNFADEDDILDDDVCIEGMRAYYMQHKEVKA